MNLPITYSIERDEFELTVSATLSLTASAPITSESLYASSSLDDAMAQTKDALAAEIKRDLVKIIFGDVE